MPAKAEGSAWVRRLSSLASMVLRRSTEYWLGTTRLWVTIRRSCAPTCLRSSRRRVRGRSRVGDQNDIGFADGSDFQIALQFTGGFLEGLLEGLTCGLDGTGVALIETAGADNLSHEGRYL